MRLKLFQVYDKVAQAVMGPILSFPNEGPAVRAFYDGLASPGTTLNSHPEDYELMELGEQDTETGRITAVPVERYVTSGAIWLATHQQRESSSSAATTNGAPHLVSTRNGVEQTRQDFSPSGR